MTTVKVMKKNIVAVALHLTMKPRQTHSAVWLKKNR